MPIELTCPSCGKLLRLADEHAGKAGRCPACQTKFTIPAAGIGPAPAGSSSPFAPIASSPTPFSPTVVPSQPSGNQFGEPVTNPFGETAPNPFASTSDMKSPYGGMNPYQSPGYAPTNWPTNSGEGAATASIVLGIITICSSVFSMCCCLGWLVTFPCGIIGTVLAFQAPPERRKIGLILNITGMVLTVVLFLGYLALNFAIAMNQNQNGGGMPPFGP